MKMDALRISLGGRVVDFPLLGSALPGPFVLKSVEGLGPPEVTVQMSKTVSDKAAYQGKTTALRQIAAVIGLKPNWDEGQTPEQLRTQLYALLTPRYNEMVQVQVMWQGAVQGYAQGQIQRLEAALFSKDPAVLIAINCDHPYFLAKDPIRHEPALRMNAQGTAAVFDVDNVGTAPSGFRMGLVLGATNTDSLMLINDGNAFGKSIIISGIAWQAGDRLVIDTRSGSRGIWRGPAGGALVPVIGNLIGGYSEWLQLYYGLNTITVSTTALFDWDDAYQFEHQPAYWGV